MCKLKVEVSSFPSTDGSPPLCLRTRSINASVVTSSRYFVDARCQMTAACPTLVALNIIVFGDKKSAKTLSNALGEDELPNHVSV